MKRLLFISIPVGLLLILYFNWYFDVEAKNPIWDNVQNTELWSHNVDPQQLAIQVHLPKPTDRGRVQIVNNTLFTDNDLPLRGEHLRISELDWQPGLTNLERAFDIDTWVELVETFNLNTVRLLLYRPPQNWQGGPGHNCPVERCFATVQDALPYIDAMVEIASDIGMYVIIDYHPVGGHDKNDAIAWWNVLAPRYKDRTHVIYELSNEPVAGGAINYTLEAVQFEEDLYQLIRSHAPDTHVISWSFSRAIEPMLEKVQAGNSISYVNASVGYHPYQWSESAINALRNAGYPVINTEIGGQSRDEYLTRTTNEENGGISWIWLDGSSANKDWSETHPLPITWDQDPKTGRPMVASPVIKIKEDTSNSLTVTIKTLTLGAEIRYTLNGSEPTESSTLYTGSFTISANNKNKVRAKAFKNKYISSAVAYPPQVWLHMVGRRGGPY